MIPRLLLTAPGSNAGKTTIACALLQAFSQQGLRLMAWKCGPDYIDPMFHSRVIGAKSRNLDGFLLPEAELCALMRRQAEGCDLGLLEGAMGFYDGIGLSAEASAWALAQRTKTPVVLVLDARGAALSLAATLRGFCALRQPSGIAGVILNRVSPMLYPRLAETLEAECGLPVFGFLPTLPECSIESRHLGLVTAEELSDLQARVARLGAAAAESLDLAGLYALAQTAPPLEGAPLQAAAPCGEGVRSALARDRAFCFYYEDALEQLAALGAELVPFSPLEAAQLPADCDGLYLGGGYPELYAGALSKYSALRAELAAAIRGGLPTVAECGGFLYLQRSLEDERGQRWPMLGVLQGEGFRRGRLGRFGYVRLTAQRDGLLLRAGESLPAHEFHYWDSTVPGEDFLAEKPLSDRKWLTGVQTQTLYAGFPHFHLCGGGAAAERFVRACAQRRRRRHETL